MGGTAGAVPRPKGTTSSAGDPPSLDVIYASLGEIGVETTPGSAGRLAFYDSPFLIPGVPHQRFDPKRHG